MAGSQPRNLKSKRFTWLRVIEKTEPPVGIKNSDDCEYWRCFCFCGKTLVATSKDLISGKTLSCGCYRETFTTVANKLQDLTNERFGHLKVLTRVKPPKHASKMKVYWLLVCDCGETVVKSGSSLSYGQIKTHCGCKDLKPLYDSVNNNS